MDPGASGDTDPISSATINQFIPQHQPVTLDSAAPAESFAGRPFARMVPTNGEARKAFNDVAEALNNDGLLSVHKRLINVTGNRQTYKMPSYTSEDTGSESELEDVSDLHVTLLDGHYVFYLDIDDQIRSQGYRLGKGRTKNNAADIDVLLIPPAPYRSMPSRIAAKSVASTHALIKMNRMSGVFVIQALSGKEPVQYLDSDDGELLNGETRVFLKTKNTILVGNLQYSFEFLVTRPEYDAYIRQRNEFLHHHFSAQASPSSFIEGIPRLFGNYRGIREALIHRSLDFGAFGVVSAGVNRKTGEPLAIKELCVKRQWDQQVVEQELAIAKLVEQGTDHRGLLVTKFVDYEHGGNSLSGRYPERIWMVSDLALSNFQVFNWTSVFIEDRLRFLQRSLYGLNLLHARGIMHRDISPKNILIASINPPEAVICDFGKATTRTRDTTYTIGPIPTLAPEVRPEGSFEYNNKIDVWALGYAWYRTFYLKRSNHAMTRELYEAMIRDVRNIGEQGQQHLQLSELMIAMLEWDPEKRISASQGLRYDCMRNVEVDIDSKDNRRRS